MWKGLGRQYKFFSLAVWWSRGPAAQRKITAHHSCNPSTPEVEVGGSSVRGQLGLPSETLFQRKTKTKNPSFLFYSGGNEARETGNFLTLTPSNCR
jgi:hypothetical protein